MKRECLFVCEGVSVLKILRYALFFLALFFILPSTTQAASLQDKIERALPGETIEIPKGVYEENLVLTKPITLKGQGKVTIRSKNEKPAITIKGKNVSVKNIKVEYTGEEKEGTAIYITGSKHQLSDITIDTTRFGIKLDQANDSKIQDGLILGKWKGNGVDLWESSRNTIQNMKIGNMEDGIYLEQSHKNKLTKNNIQLSRYGMHLMYSDDVVLKDNISYYNMTGTMLMKVDRIQVIGNDLSFNSSNVNSQGLLIYYMKDSLIAKNTLNANRLGIYIETSENNQIEYNQVKNNFIGVQFKKANDNQLINNTFVGNVNEAQAIESNNNRIDHNYWDASAKLDMKGNGKSIIPFTADPYFLTLTADVPEFQLFFQAPGVTLLQKMLKSPANQVLTDATPLMEPTVEVEKEQSSYAALWSMSLLMIVASISLYLFGRKRI